MERSVRDTLEKHIGKQIYIRNKRQNIYTGVLTSVNDTGELKIEVHRLRKVHGDLSLEKLRYGTKRTFQISNISNIQFSTEFNESKLRLFVA